MRNQKFNILSALGIILVVGGHSGIEFIPWFTPYSFHMPLFIFISGYFFHNYPWKEFLWKKVKHLLLPLLLWNAFYVILEMLLWEWELNKLAAPQFSLWTFLWSPLIVGATGTFNCPAWFIGTLFWVQILFWWLHRFIGEKPLAVGIIAVLFFEGSVWWATHGGVAWFYQVGLGINRVLFCFIFYWLGYMYHMYWEKRDVFSINKIIALFAVNGSILGFVSSNIVYYVANMTFFSHKYWLPFVTACSGIWVCLQVASLLQDKIKSTEIFSKIGEHTFSIMMHHMLFFWLLNAMFYYLRHEGVLRLDSFDYNKYMTYIYYRVQAHATFTDLLYVGVCIGGPLLSCWIYEKFLQKYVYRVRNQIKNFMFSID